MIATCPHCQSGFYIASELAGAVVTCSKCKKQVRAPDRRGCAPGPLSEANDGIPVAMLAETRAEAEEHLKNETEARFELEKKIKDSLEAKAKAEFQAKIDAQARQEAEERLKQEVSARAAIEAKLLTETDARRKVEESAMAEKQARGNFEEKLKTETEARLKADVQVEAISRELAEVKTKLTEAEDARKEAEARVVKETEAKGQLEQRLQAETESKIKAESQAKAEALAKKKYQSQAESETEAITKLEQELEAVKTRIRDAKVATRVRRPINITKGLSAAGIYSVACRGGHRRVYRLYQRLYNQQSLRQAYVFADAQQSGLSANQFNRYQRRQLYCGMGRIPDIAFCNQGILPVKLGKDKNDYPERANGRRNLCRRRGQGCGGHPNSRLTSEKFPAYRHVLAVFRPICYLFAKSVMRAGIKLPK